MEPSGHTVAHNRITNVADGVSTPRTNVDIFGNDIFDTADDGLELDFGLANVRVWRNRIHNAYHNGISFQPQNSGPWYIVRNQIVGSAEAPFKFRTTDRFVLVNNTIVNFAGEMICCSQSHLLRGFLRNNLWISARAVRSGTSKALSDWRTDIDYDGFDWGDTAYPLVWGGRDLLRPALVRQCFAARVAWCPNRQGPMLCRLPGCGTDADADPSTPDDAAQRLRGGRCGCTSAESH
jgi:hypothetical protein